MTYYLVSLQSC